MCFELSDFQPSMVQLVFLHHIMVYVWGGEGNGGWPLSDVPVRKGSYYYIWVSYLEILFKIINVDTLLQAVLPWGIFA